MTDEITFFHPRVFNLPYRLIEDGTLMASALAIVLMIHNDGWDLPEAKERLKLTDEEFDAAIAQLEGGGFLDRLPDGNVFHLRADGKKD